MPIEAIGILEPVPEDAPVRHAVDNGCGRFDFRHRLADGSIRDVRVCSSPILLGGRQLLWSVIQ